MHLTRQISDYAEKVLSLYSRHRAAPGKSALFDELYEQASQGIEELRIVDEELRQREIELETASQSIFQERRRYQNLFALAPDAYLLTDGDGILVEANAKAEQLFEVAGDHLRGKPLAAFIASRRQRGSFRSWFSTLRKVKTASSIDLTLNAQRRGRFPAEIHVAPVPGDDLDSNLFLWVIRDVSATRRARRDAELAAIVRASGDAMLTQATDGRIGTWNHAAELLYGYEPKQIIGRSIERLIAPESLRDHAAAIANLSNEEPVRTIDSLHLRWDGMRINVGVTCSLISEPLTSSPGVALIVHEITDRKLLEARLREQALEREQSDRRKTDFIAMLAHELRSPLNVLISALQMFRDKADQNLQAELPEMCLRNARYMGRLVEELLDLSRISRDELQVVPRRVPVQEFVRRGVELARPVLEEHQQAIALDLPEEPIDIFGDDVRLAQAITNLLDNAAKYSPGGTEIALIVRQRARHVTIDVEDGGAGIPAELIGRVFEPFVQGEPARRRSRSGLGLGLALVKKIVDLHGGSVSAKSPGINRGSTFTIALPLDGGPIVPGPNAEPESDESPSASDPDIGEY